MDNRIKELRDERGWTMRDLAERLNSTSSTINKLEKGFTRLNVDWIRRMSEVFGVSPQEVMQLPNLEYPDAGQNDLTPYDGDLQRPGLAKTQSRYVVNSKALDQLGIMPSSILVSDANPDVISRINTGAIVVAVVNRGVKQRLVLRQFVWPSILIANSSMLTPPLINLRLHDVAIKGIVVSSLNQFGTENFNSGSAQK